MLLAVILLVIASITIWFSSSYAIQAAENISLRSHLSRLTISVFVLGLVTSFPEVLVTVNSVWLNAPQIALGNLIGSQIVLLFLVIPVLAIVSGKLDISLDLKRFPIVFTLLLAVVSMLALINQSLEIWEAVALLVLYAIFAFTYVRQPSFLENISRRLAALTSVHLSWEIGKLLVTVGVLFLATNVAVRQLIEIAAWLETPRFLLSVIILPISSNLPELSLALGSLKAGKKDLALGDYLGSITFNSLLAGLLALSLGGQLVIGQNINLVLIMFGIGVLIFGWCVWSQKQMSVKEGLLLLVVYGVLVCTIGWVILRGLGQGFN